MRTRLVLAVAPLALVAVAALPSSAAPKPMSGAYPASAPVPSTEVGCDGSLPGSIHTEAIKVPGAGRFSAELSGFTADWDFFLRSNGSEISASTGGLDAPVEVVSAKIKKAGTINIVSCNWAGGPTGNVKWKFEPAK